AIPEAPPLPELYTVLLHNVLFNGSRFPEDLSCNVKMININPASPAHVMIPAGKSNSITFNLSTGVKLTNVTFSSAFYFPVNIEPVTVEEIPEMGMQTINVTINVPSNASPGRYFSAIYLMASELPMSIPIYVYVDVPTIEKLDVKLDIGEIHFPGEIADVYLQFSYKGAPINLTDTIPLKLWYRKADGEFLFMNFDAILLDSGLYVAQFEIPIEATSCCLIVSIESYSEDINVLYRGTSMDSFDISSTLIDWNAYLQTITGDIATIKTDIGMINANLTSINATLTSINGTTVEIRTLLGPIQGSIDALGLRVTLIDGNITLIKTALGELEGIIESIDGNVTTIKTDIGTLKVNVDDIEGYVESLPQTTFQNFLGTVAAVILSLIAAICSATLLFRLGKKMPS
ncbi:MAG: hypothetical protein QXL57_08725, partial [Candidatus Bathyarchaeia archaeon]